MSCGWCGHGHCHGCGCGHCHYCEHGYGSPPWLGYQRPGYGARPRYRRALTEEDLAAYLDDLEEEVGQVREELESLRRSAAGRADRGE